MPVADNPPDEDVHFLVVRIDLGMDVQTEAIYIWGAEGRQLYNWFDTALRQEYSNVAGAVKSQVGELVWLEAYEAGRRAATNGEEYKLSAQAMPIWRDGFNAGWAEGKSTAAGEM